MASSVSVRPKGQLTRGHGQRHLLVAAHDLGIGFQLLEEFLGLLVAPRREQAGGMRGRGAEQRLGNAHAAAPLRIDQVDDRPRPIGFGNQIAC